MPMEADSSGALLVQSDSEKRMLRIFYYLRFLRAMIFNIVFSILAIGAFVFFGDKWFISRRFTIYKNDRNSNRAIPIGFHLM